MAVDNALIMEQSVFGAAPETTTGTALTLDAGDAGMNIFNCEWNPEASYISRPGQGSASRLKGTVGRLAAGFTFRTELTGNGASGLPYYASTLFPACGFPFTSTTASPSTGNASQSTLTMAKWVDGQRFQIAGAVGTFAIDGNSGEPVYVDWDFMGKRIAPAAEGNVAPTYPTVDIPRFANGTLTVGGTQYKIGGFNIAVTQNKAPRFDANDSSGTGIYAFTLAGERVVTITLRELEMVALGTKNWWTDYTSYTTAAVNIVVGTASNNTITLNAPVAQLAAEPSLGDREGIVVNELTFEAVRSAAAGDDELTIAFS